MFKKIILSLSTSCLFFVGLFHFDLDWLGELFISFAPVWLVLSVILSGISLVLIRKDKSYSGAVLFGFLSVILFINKVSLNYLLHTETYFPKSFVTEKLAQDRDSSTYDIVLLNILSSNRNYVHVRQLIAKSNPDFVAVLEFNSEWQNELNPIQTDYPYFYHLPREDNFGIGFWSKYPLKNAISIRQTVTNSNSRSNIPALHFKLALDSLQPKNILDVIVAHPIPPINKEAFDNRNAYLYEMAEYVSQLHAYPNKNIIFVGDLNCTPFSREYHKILFHSTLLDSRINYGYQPTWHSEFPFLLQIPLDHLWHSKDMLIKQRQTLEIIGSDHKALWVRFKPNQNIR